MAPFVVAASRGLFAKDGLNVSINYATGERTDQTEKLEADGTYVLQRPRRRKARPAVLYMENTPDPSMVLGLA